MISNARSFKYSVSKDSNHSSKLDSMAKCVLNDNVDDVVQKDIENILTSFNEGLANKFKDEDQLFGTDNIKKQKMFEVTSLALSLIGEDGSSKELSVQDLKDMNTLFAAAARDKGTSQGGDSFTNYSKLGELVTQAEIKIRAAKGNTSDIKKIQTEFSEKVSILVHKKEFSWFKQVAIALGIAGIGVVGYFAIGKTISFASVFKVLKTVALVTLKFLGGATAGAIAAKSAIATGGGTVVLGIAAYFIHRHYQENKALQRLEESLKPPSVFPQYSPQLDGVR